MTARPFAQAWSLAAAVVAAGATAAPRAQPAPAPQIAEVRQTVDAARREIDAYRAAGGSPAAQDHPAVKWDAALWGYRERYPGSEAAALATSEAVRLLVRAELWDRAHARVESLDADEAAWARLPPVIYSEGIARNDLAYTIERLTRAAARTTRPAIRAAALVTIGRAHRRTGDNAAATRALEEARAAAPGTPAADEADGLIYEIAHLSPGLEAPPFSARARSGRTVDLRDYRGRAVVLVFWGST
jgi:hypothetical protein